MPDDFSDWIKKYNTEKKWPTIQVAKAAVQEMDLPEKGMEKLLTKSRAYESKLAKELGEMRQTVEALKTKVNQEKRDREKFRAQNDLRIAEAKLVEIDTRHTIAEQLTLERAKRLKQMNDITAGVRSAIEGIHAEIDTINDPAKVAVPVGDPTRMAYDTRRAEVVARIDEERKKFFTLVSPNLKDVVKYPGIGAPEYTLLLTMLLKGDAHAVVGDPDKANAVLDETLAKLVDLASARRGVIFAETKPDRNPEVAGPVSDAQSAIATIRKAGLRKLAEKLDLELVGLDQQFTNNKASPKSGLTTEDLVKPHQEFAARCLTAATQISGYKGAVTEMGQLVSDLRLLGDNAGADAFETQWSGREQSADIATERKWVDGQITRIRTALGVVRDAAAKAETVDPAELRQKLADIKANVETMFKHASDGSRRQEEDGASQQQKDVSKDTRIPREALDEIALQVKMAELLIESNSVEALKRASTYLDAVKTFETDVKNHAKTYEAVRNETQKINDIFKKLEKKYTDFLLPERSELRILLELFEKDYKKQAPKTNAAKLDEYRTKAEAILTKAKVLSADYKKFESEATSVQKSLDSMGANFKENKYSRNGTPVTGYYGALVTRMGEARAEAAKRGAENIANGMDGLEEIRLKIDDWLPVVERRFNSPNGWKGLSENELKQWRLIRADALAGQTAHDADAQHKKTWAEERTKLSKRLRKLKKSFLKRRLDPADVELLILEFDTLVTQQKTLPSYAEAVEQVERMKTAATLLEARASEFDSFEAAPIGDATKLVCDRLRDFVAFVSGFEAVVRKADDAADTKYDLSGFSKFLDLVKDAVPDAAIKDLEAKGNALNQDTVLSPKTRALREQALADVRLINGRLRSTAAIKHFREQTFQPDGSLDVALAALDRLQIKLLTALK